MTDILQQGMDFVEKIRMSRSMSDTAMIGFAALLVLGIVNCILGYRLLRFWMMLFGFLIGTGLGFGGAYSMGITDKYMLAGIAAVVGILLAVIAFLSYKIGIFVLGGGIGLGLGIYIIHPTSSLTFFICIIAGIALGVLAIRWVREVLIVGTSLLGGVMAGFSMARLSGLADVPYGLGFSAGFAFLGMLIQFTINRERPEEEEEDAPDEENIISRGGDYVDPADYIPERRSSGHRGSAKSGRAVLEEAIDEEVFREMLEEDSREGEELWQKFSRKGRTARKKTGNNISSQERSARYARYEERENAKPEQQIKEEHYGKRSKNKRNEDA